MSSSPPTLYANFRGKRKFSVNIYPIFFFSRVCKVLYLLKQFDGMAMAKGKSKCGRRKKNEKTAKQTAFKTLPCRLIKSVSLRP